MENGAKEDHRSSSTERQPGTNMGRFIWAFFIAIQLVGLFCLLNPWTEAWRGKVLVLFLVEGLIFAAVFIPLSLYNYFRKGLSLTQSLTKAMETMLDAVSATVP